MIIHYRRPARDLPFDGERFTSAASGPIEHEHIHRYLFALQFCVGKRVLDIASGEGFGSALLAQASEYVIGIDIAEEAVQHAQANYGSTCLEFRRGDCLDLPLADASVDVVVSFETLEHITDHEKFFFEIRRVLRPGGVFVVSTPDTNVYTLESGFSNPHHLKELTRSEFRASILARFRYCSFFEQKAFNGSVINTWPEAAPGAFEFFSRSETEKIERHAAIPKPPYVIAVASDEPLRPISTGLYDDLGFIQRFEGYVVRNVIENVFGERGSQDCELIFSTKVSDPIAAGRTCAERAGQSIIVTASDDDPRLHIPLPKPHHWLLLIADIVAERECTGQVFTRVVGQESVDRRTAQSFTVVPGLNKIRLLLSRDTPVNLVRLDPGDQPGKFVLLRVEVLGASDAYSDTPGPKKKCDASVASSEEQSSSVFPQHICLEHSRMANPSGEYQDSINTRMCIFKPSLLRSPDVFNSYVLEAGHREVQGWVTTGALTVTSVFSNLQRLNGIEGNICEIGVHHGRYMIALSLLRGVHEKSLAIDVFEDQDLNIDKSGLGDATAFTNNVTKWLGSAPEMLIMKADSLTVSSADIIQRLGGEVRLFSVDGSHTCEHTLNDIEIAQGCLVDGGIVVVDDFFNPDWPGVPEALVRFLDRPEGQRRLVPIGYGDNKFYLTTIGYDALYKNFLLNFFRSHLVHLKPVRLCGFDVLRFASQPVEKVLAKPPVAHGSIQRLSTEGGSLPLVGSWSIPERTGTWGTGKWSGLAFRLAPSHAIMGQRLTIAIEVACFRHPKCPEPSLDVFVFEEKVKTVHFPSNVTDLTITIEIDAEDIACDGGVEIWFRNLNATAPSELGISSDQRKLSFFAKSLEVR